MTENNVKLVFYYKEFEVGHFEESSYPSSPGQYRYMPYRGRGHYEMGLAIKAGQIVRCAYKQGQKKVSFVVDWKEYGLLILKEFKIEND